MKPKEILGYTMLSLLLYGHSLGFVAAIWTLVAPDRFYHCSDDVPILTFFPPFVHGVLSDHYIRPEGTVYAIWSCFLIVGLAAPSILFWRIVRSDLRKELALLNAIGPHRRSSRIRLAFAEQNAEEAD